jgi:hypothetical protein
MKSPEDQRSVRRANRKKRFRDRMATRYSLRGIMTLMMTCSGLSALAVNSALLSTLKWPFLLRYPVAATVSYLVFLALVQIWLKSIRGKGGVRRNRRAKAGVARYDDQGNWIDDWDDVLDVGIDGAAVAMGTRSVSASAAEPQAGVSTVTAADDGALRLSNLGLDGADDDDAAAGIAIALLFVAVCGTVFFGFYLIAIGPTLLGEAAFQVAITTGLVRSPRYLSEDHWITDVMFKTLPAFLLLQALIAGFGFYAWSNCPSALRITELFARGACGQ